MDRQVMDFFEKFEKFFLGQNFAQIIGRFFLEKISPNALKFRPIWSPCKERNKQIKALVSH
jgi:hypothetical protein